MRLILCVLALAIAAGAYHERFDEGWQTRWVHSEDSKYAGNNLIVEQAPNSDQSVLKVSDKVGVGVGSRRVRRAEFPSDVPKLVFVFSRTSSSSTG